MSRSGEVELQFGATRRLFRLGVGELIKLEEECGAGTPEILASLAPIVAGLQGGMSLSQMLLNGRLGTWKTIYIRAPLFWGLVGADNGLTRTEAGALVGQEFDAAPGFEHAVTAFLILQAAWAGSEVEPVGEKTGAAKRPRAKRRSRMAEPAGQPSTV